MNWFHLYKRRKCYICKFEDHQNYISILKDLRNLFGCRPNFYDNRRHGKSVKWGFGWINYNTNGFFDKYFNIESIESEIKSYLFIRYPNLIHHIKIYVDGTTTHLRGYIRFTYTYHSKKIDLENYYMVSSFHNKINWKDKNE